MPFFVIALSLMVFMIVGWRYTPFLSQLNQYTYNLKQTLYLAITGIVCFICDVIGIGSFAPQIAALRLSGFINDEQVPAIVNGAQVIPGALEAILFLKVVPVDTKTLVTCVIGACLGGLIGGHEVTISSRSPKMTVTTGKKAMLGTRINITYSLPPCPL